MNMKIYLLNFDDNFKQKRRKVMNETHIQVSKTGLMMNI